jgi:RNA polymerase sigma-70 factor (ECF subfamily)
MLQAMTCTETPVDGESLEETVEAARSGDQRAFEHLYRTTVGPVYGLCLRLTANPSLAEECVQRAYIQAWRNLGKFRGDSAVTTWLHRIAVNEVRGHFRGERRHEPGGSLEDEPSAAQDQPGSVDLERAIAALPDRARSVFVLVGIYGYPHAEAARMLDIATGTSKAHYHRARKQLKRMLGEQT